MKLYARTSQKSYLNNHQGEDWQEVRETQAPYPSGWRDVVEFQDGFRCKVEYCELAYVF